MKEGWEYKKLKEVGLTQTGTTPSKQIKSFYGGDIPFIRPAELNIDQNGGILYESELKLTEEGALKARVIKENSVLMCCIGSVGKTGFTLRSVTCNQQINTITPYDNYNPKFVYYALISPSFQQEVTKIANSAKATLPIISKGKWEVLSIPIPSLSEQQSIVDYLDSAFAKIDAMKANAEKALDEAKALFQASLKEMLEPKTGWEEKKLKEVGRTQTGTTPSKSVESFYGGNIPFIRPAELDVDGRGAIEYNSELKLTPEGALKSRMIRANSILMCCIGSVGKTGYSIKDVTCNQQINTITPYEGYNGKYVYYALLAPSFQKEVIKIANSAKATLAIISKGKWEDMSIPVPPLSEQLSIVDYLDKLNSKVARLQENYNKTSQECDALKQALLRQVFE